MSYKLIKKNTPNKDKGRNKPKQIIIHHWGKEGQSFDGVVNWLCNPKAGTSAHYVVEGGKVAKLASESDATWHAGNYSVNCSSIGIECRPEMSPSDLATVVELVADIFKRYGTMPVRGHKDIVATACPGKYYKKLDYIKREAIKRNQNKKPEKWYCDYITLYDINFREKASTSAKVLGTIPKGTHLRGDLVKGGWLKTKYKGNSGYCRVVANRND